MVWPLDAKGRLTGKDPEASKEALRAGREIGERG